MLEKYLTYDKFVPPIKYRNDVNPKDPKVLEYIAEIEKIPDQIQKLIACEGSYIVFFNGALTDQPEMRHAKGEQLPGWDKGTTWDAMRGCHLRGENYYSSIVFLGIKGHYIGTKNIALHEYGHCLDNIMGQIIFGLPVSSTPEFEKIWQTIRNLPNGTNQTQFIADAIEQFYTSKKTRDELIDMSLDTARLIKGIEEWAAAYELSEEKPPFSLASIVKKSNPDVKTIYCGRVRHEDLILTPS